ncbi:lipopolysaccharide biosynthesis protein [Castellaniella ginsengisoli]
MRIKNQVLGNALIYLVATVFNAAIPFILLPILTRVLSPSDYGVVSMFLVMLSIFSAVVGLSMNGVISIRYFQLGRTRLAEYISTITIMLVFTTFMAVAVVFLVGDWMASITGVPMGWLMAAVIVSGVQFIINIKLTLLQVEGKAKKFGVLQVSQSFINAVASLGLVLIAGMAWQGRVLGHALSVGLLGLVVILWMSRDKLFVRPVAWREHGRDALRFGLPLIPHAIGGWLLIAGDRFIVKENLGLTDTGIYMAAMQVGMGLHMAYEAFFRSWHPAITKSITKNEVKDRRLLVRSVYKVMSGSFLALSIYCLLVWLVYPWLVGEKFSAGIWIALVFAVSAFFSACYYATAIFMHIQNRNELLAVNTFVSGGIGLVLSLILCQDFGLLGVAVGMLIGKILAFIFCWISANYVFPMPWLRPFS